MASTLGSMKFLFASFLLSAAILPAQSIGVGVKGGVPLTDTFKTVNLGRQAIAEGNWIFGPMFELRLPAGLGVEFDTLYRRSTVKDGPQVGSWEFPLLGKLRLPGVILRPTLGAGVMFQRLADITSFDNRKGFVMSAGVEVKAPFVRIAPELRYTRFSEKRAGTNILNGSNQVDVLIGLTF